MGNLDRRADRDVLNERYLEEYRQAFSTLRDDLVYLHSNLRLLSQLRQFPARLFQAPRALFSFLTKNLTTECVQICCRVWKDKSSQALTLNRLADSLLAEAIRPRYRDELMARLLSARVPDSVESTISRLRSIRNASIAHLDHQVIRAIKSRPDRVSFDELMAAAKALGVYLNALTFGSRYEFVIAEFCSQEDPWFKGDLGYVLDRIALGSRWLSEPDEHRAFWRVFRRKLDTRQLHEINDVRIRHGMPPLD